VQARQVVGGDRFFEPADPNSSAKRNPRRRPGCGRRRRWRPRRVPHRHDRSATAPMRSMSCCHDAPRSCRSSSSRAESPGPPIRELIDEALLAVGGEAAAAVDWDGVARRAQHAEQRLVSAARLGVPQRDVDGCDGRRGDAGAARLRMLLTIASHAAVVSRMSRPTTTLASMSRISVPVACPERVANPVMPPRVWVRPRRCSWSPRPASVGLRSVRRDRVHAHIQTVDAVLVAHGTGSILGSNSIVSSRRAIRQPSSAPCRLPHIRQQAASGSTAVSGGRSASNRDAHSRGRGVRTTVYATLEHDHRT